MNLFENIALFLPLCLVICLVSSSLGREDIKDIVRQGLRLFATMSISIVGICAIIFWIMEYTLDH